jgi:hypothetical protein
MSKPYCDPALKTWMTSEDTDVREVIVEACLPPRHVEMAKGDYGRSVPVKLVSGSPEVRIKILGELHDFLNQHMHLRATVLKSAGAVVVCASGDDVQLILKNPLVKAVRPNRKLSL